MNDTPSKGQRRSLADWLLELPSGCRDRAARFATRLRRCLSVINAGALAWLFNLCLAAIISPADAAISFIASATTTANSNSITVSAPSGVLAGQVLVAFIAQRDGAALAYISTPAGWTSVLSTDNGSSLGVTLFWKTATVADVGSSYTWILDRSDRTAVGIVAFSGVDTTNPVNVSNASVNSASTTYTAPSVTTTTANTMRVAFYGAINGNGSVNAGTGMTAAFTDGTLAGPNGVVIGSSYVTQAAAGASGAALSTENASLVSIGVQMALNGGTSSVHHYELSLPTSSIACLTSTVTVTACADSSAPCTRTYPSASGTTATLATTAGALAANTVTFNVAGVATTTLSYPAAANGASLSVTLSGEQVAATSPRQCCPNGINCGAANNCSTSFNTSGFLFAIAANGVAATIPPQIAGTSSNTYYLRAVRTNTTTKACETALTGNTTVNMAYECNNPTTCSTSNLMSINGGASTTIARNANGSVSSYTAVGLTFDSSGNAPFTFNHGDAGQVRLHASKPASSPLLTALSGSSNAFVVKPAAFFLTATCDSTGTTNAASQTSPSAADAKFCAAGRTFSAAVTALTAGGIVTPNYGRESPPEIVVATWSRALPTTPMGGSDGVLPSGTLAFAGGFSGTFTGSGLKWSEVGILAAALTVGDSDYLGAGNVTASAYVGRFHPDHFDVVVTPQCGGFVYSGRVTASAPTGRPGQPFTVKATAMNGLAAPTPTTNYSSAAGFSRDVTLTLSSGGAVGQLYVDSTPGGTGAIPAGKFGSSVGTVAYSDPSGKISYVFNAFPTAPTTITVHADDADSATSTGTDGVTAARAGRLQMGSAYGSELLALPIPLEAQYWAAGGYYVTNRDDICTNFAASSIVLSNFTQNLAACETRFSPSGTVTLAKGLAPLRLTAPGGGNDGSVSLALNVGSAAAGSTCVSSTSSAATAANLPWFGSTNPAGRATFGVFKTPLIYRRESY